MAVLSLKVIDKNDKTRYVSSGEDQVVLVNTSQYAGGDRICLETDTKNIFVWIQFDDALGASLVFITDNISYDIPFGEKRISYSPKAFHGDMHYLYARTARDDEIYAYRNHALNIYDFHGKTNCFPHAYANVETRNEAVFAARIAIDGVIANHAHGAWPYESWGINRRDDACITVEFGNEIVADKVVLYLRADFPHDNWWKQVKLVLSDGEELVCELKKTALGQEIPLNGKVITDITLKELIKSDDPSPFPALTQIEVYGTLNVCGNKFRNAQAKEAEAMDGAL